MVPRVTKGIGLALIFSIMLSGSIVALENSEYTEPSVRMTAQSMRAYQTRWAQLTQYTMNAGTPGFTELASYNVLDDEGNIVTKPFFRFRVGPVVETHSELDFYLDAQGRGFFTIQMPTGVAFTKDGRFTLDARRRIVTKAGQYPVLSGSGEITVPQGNEIAVAANGRIFVDGNPVEKFKVIVFESFEEMQKLDTLNGVIFVMNQPIQTVDGEEHYKIRQGYVEETSFLNVLVGDMHVARRGYEASAKAVKAISRIMGETSHLAVP